LIEDIRANCRNRCSFANLFPKWGCFKTYSIGVLFWQVKIMHGANGGGAFRQAVPRGVGVAILAGDLAFSYVALESPFLLAIWPCMVRGPSQSGALLCPRVAARFAGCS